MPTRGNWARNQRCEPRHVAQPPDEVGLSLVVRWAARNGMRARVVGAGHSWSRVACTDETLISLDAMQDVVSVDGTRVTVQAGMRLHQLNRALAERGLALPMVGSIDQQSVAGALSTATHGSGRHGVLSTRAVALRLVMADGSVRALSAEREPALFDAARAGLGLYGVISEVTLDCVPATRIAQRATPTPFAQALEQLPELFEAHEHLKIWWIPHQDLAQVYTADATPAPNTPATLAERIDAAVLNPVLFPMLLGLGSAVPALIPPLNKLIASSYFSPSQRVGLPFEVLHLAMPPRHLEAEYSVPLERAAEAFRALRAVIERGGHRVNFMQELRPVTADTLPLSPATGRDSAYISAYVARRAGARRFFQDVEAALGPLGARPHWGKLHHFTPAQLRAAYPQWAQAMALRREVDPEGRFLSPYMAELLGEGV
ncbi:MAG: FAD-binding protein [Alphaproteobacteria bacterium]|nr:FAD-binding protein [Alphaproteobacteria bacterium]